MRLGGDVGGAVRDGVGHALGAEGDALGQDVVGARPGMGAGALRAIAGRRTGPDPVGHLGPGLERVGADLQGREQARAARAGAVGIAAGLRGVQALPVAVEGGGRLQLPAVVAGVDELRAAPGQAVDGARGPGRDADGEGRSLERPADRRPAAGLGPCDRRRIRGAGGPGEAGEQQRRAGGTGGSDRCGHRRLLGAVGLAGAGAPSRIASRTPDRDPRAATGPRRSAARADAAFGQPHACTII